MAITLKAIHPKVFNAAAIDVFIKPVEETLDEAEKLYAKTYRTWSHKPEFEKSIEVSNGAIEGSYLTSGEGSKDNPYPFVARGTPVRYAQLSSDWVSKTQPGVIGSGRGRGRVIMINKNRPRPGIEDRRWEPDIAKKLKPGFNRKMKKAAHDFVVKSGHKL